MFSAFLAVYAVCSRHIEQAAVDGLATCWRNLRHEHGEHVEVSYMCDQLRANHRHCRLQVATCPELTVYQSDTAASEAKTFTGTDDFLSFTLEFQHDHVGRTFRLIIKDHFQQGIILSGKIGTAVLSRKRQLGVIDSLNNIGKSVDPHWKGFAESGVFGVRRDCIQEDCPIRWSDCWPGANTTMMQIQVFLVMDSTFCASFASTASCEQFTLGMFGDANLLYEEQMGISLRPAVLLPPEAFEKYWPAVHNAKYGDVVDGNTFLMNFTTLSCGGGDDGSYFLSVIGRPVSFFGIFHIIVGREIEMISSGKTISGNIVGLATIGTLCTCASVGWTRHANEGQNSKTWETFAHEVAHNFGGQHYFKHVDVERGVSPDAGILGYGDGTVLGMFAFNEVNKEELCEMASTKMLANNSMCFTPYFGVQERDPRFGLEYLVVFATFIAFLSMIAICFCLFAVTTCQHARLVKRYKKQKVIHKCKVKLLQHHANSQEKIIKAAYNDLICTEQELQQAYVDQDVLADEAAISDTVAIDKAEELQVMKMNFAEMTAIGVLAEEHAWAFSIDSTPNAENGAESISSIENHMDSEVFNFSSAPIDV